MNLADPDQPANAQANRSLPSSPMSKTIHVVSHFAERLTVSNHDGIKLIVSKSAPGRPIH